MALADATPFAESKDRSKVDVDLFLSGLRHAWQEVRDQTHLPEKASSAERPTAS
jgi:hypothetical protein